MTAQISHHVHPSDEKQRPRSDQAGQPWPPKLTRRGFLRQLLLAASGTALGATAGRCTPSASPEAEPSPHDRVPITVLHVNDFHGALRAKTEDGGEAGGAANLVFLIDRKRGSAPGSVLLLDAGDAFQGTYISNANYGQAMTEIMNVARVDALTLGNHEFDWGPEVLQARIRQAEFPVLAANLETASGQMLEGVAPYAVLDADGIRVGVLGLTYHSLNTVVKASAIEGLRSLPPVETVERYLPELRERSDLIIVLSHLGLEADVELARAVPGIPLVVGGHTHDVLHGGERVGDTVIVQAGAYGQYLGRVVLHFDRESKQVVKVDTEGEVTKVTDAGTPSGEVEAIVLRSGQEADEIGSRVIGEAVVPLKKGRGIETALGNLITDAIRAADLGDGQPFDIALHNDGGIRADLDAGPITFSELYAVLPFDNNLVGLDLTGEGVKEMLENGISNRASEIQVSGLSFVYSLNKSRGRRVMEVTVNGEPLDRTRTYRVVTIDYLYTHPQYADSLGKGSNVFFGPLCLDAVSDHIRAHSPVRARVEQRIRRM